MTGQIDCELSAAVEARAGVPAIIYKKP